MLFVIQKIWEKNDIEKVQNINKFKQNTYFFIYDRHTSDSKYLKFFSQHYNNNTLKQITESIKMKYLWLLLRKFNFCYAYLLNSLLRCKYKSESPHFL